MLGVRNPFDKYCCPCLTTMQLFNKGQIVPFDNNSLSFLFRGIFLCPCFLIRRIFRPCRTCSWTRRDYICSNNYCSMPWGPRNSSCRCRSRTSGAGASSCTSSSASTLLFLRPPPPPLTSPSSCSTQNQN